MTDFAYDGPIFLVPLSLSYPSSHVVLEKQENLVVRGKCLPKEQVLGENAGSISGKQENLDV